MERTVAVGGGGQLFPERSLLAERSEEPRCVDAHLPSGHLEVAGMPVVSLWDGRMVGVEVLARWRTTEGRVLLPAEFLPRVDEAPWSRVPGYIIFQLAGAVLAVVFLQAVIGSSASNGATYPAQSTTDVAAFLMEVVLTFGLVSVILGTASGAQNIGIIGALGVGGYVALAGLWASPLSGASMNPIRSFAPDLVANDFTSYWVYLAGPMLGAALAVVGAYMLRGRGGGLSGSQAAQGALFTQPKNPEKA